MLVADGYSCRYQTQMACYSIENRGAHSPGRLLDVSGGASARQLARRPALEAEQLQQIVSSADELLFPVDLLQAP